MPVPILDLDAPVPQMVETVGGCLESLRPAAARASYRSAQDLSSGRGPAPCCSSKAAAGGKVGGSADEPRLRSCCRGRANLWVGGQHGLCLSSSTPPGQGGIQILATATVADHKFQQSMFSSVLFIYRVVVIPVATQRQVCTALSVQRTV